MNKIADGFSNEKAIVIPHYVRKTLDGNPITRNLYVTHIGYYPRAKFHYRERSAGCSENILIYCDQGAGRVTCDGEEHRLHPNQVFIIPAGMPHSYQSALENPWSIYWFHFRGDFVVHFEGMLNKVITLAESAESRFEDRLLLFEEMYQNLEMGYSRDNLEYVSFCLMHFLASLKYTDQFREIKKAKETDTVRKSIRYMKENLEGKISLEDIALHVGYSPSRFGTLFLQRTACSPLEYYGQLKIQRACGYLQFSELKIKEISFRLGYYDPFHFSKAFKKEMRVTPREYRKRCFPDKTDL